MMSFHVSAVVIDVVPLCWQHLSTYFLLCQPESGEIRESQSGLDCCRRYTTSRLLYCNKCRHFPTCTAEYILSAVHVGYMPVIPAVIHIPAHCNLTGRSMTLRAPVLSPRSILPPPSSHYAFIPTRKNSARV
jgi:hypothetical protein